MRINMICRDENICIVIGIRRITLVNIQAMKNPNMSPNTAADKFLIENLFIAISINITKIDQDDQIRRIKET